MYYRIAFELHRRLESYVRRANILWRGFVYFVKKKLVIKRSMMISKLNYLQERRILFTWWYEVRENNMMRNLFSHTKYLLQRAVGTFLCILQGKVKGLFLWKILWGKYVVKMKGPIVQAVDCGRGRRKNFRPRPSWSIWPSKVWIHTRMRSFFKKIYYEMNGGAWPQWFNIIENCVSKRTPKFWLVTINVRLLWVNLSELLPPILPSSYFA